MKIDRASAAENKRGEAVRVRSGESALGRKAAVKSVSASAHRKADAGGARSPFSFVPHDAKVKVSRWPKL